MMTFAQLIRQLGDVLRFRRTTAELRKIFGPALDSEIETIRMLSKLRQPAGISAIVPYLYHDVASLRRTANEAIAALLQEVSPRRYVVLDQQVRAVRWMRGEHVQRPIMNERVERLLRDEATPTRLVIAAMYADGHVRHRAVRLLAGSDDVSAALPMLVVRCNDWVAQVRNSATRAVRGLIKHENAAHFISNLYLVDRLTVCGRADHHPLVKDILLFLKRPECIPQLVDALQHKDPFACRICYRLLAESAQVGPQMLWQASQLSFDPIVRMRGLRDASNRLRGESLYDAMSQAIADPNLPHRRIALQTIVASFPEGARAHLYRALFDKHASMRQLARYELRLREADIDFRGIYIAALHSPRPNQQAAAIAGFGECGESEDIAALRGFLDHADPGIRSESLRALFRLDPDAFREPALAALEDPSDGVIRTAARLLDGKLQANDLPALERVLSLANGPVAALGSLRLIGQFRNWTAAAILLEHCRHPVECFAQAAMDIFWNLWYRRLGHLPVGSMAELDRAEAALGRLAGLRSKYEMDAVAADIRAMRRVAQSD